MNKPYYIGFFDKPLNKYLFMGHTETTWMSDFQSAKSYSKPEIKRELPIIKRRCKDKRLKVIKIVATEI